MADFWTSLFIGLLASMAAAWAGMAAYRALPAQYRLSRWAVFLLAVVILGLEALVFLSSIFSALPAFPLSSTTRGPDAWDVLSVALTLLMVAGFGYSAGTKLEDGMGAKWPSASKPATAVLVVLALGACLAVPVTLSIEMSLAPHSAYGGYGNAKSDIQQMLKALYNQGAGNQLKEKTLFDKGIMTREELVQGTPINEQDVQFACDPASDPNGDCSAGADSPIQGANGAGPLIIIARVTAAVSVCKGVSRPTYFICIGSTEKATDVALDCNQRCNS